MTLVNRALRRLGLGSYLPRNVFEVADLDCLMRALRWQHAPVLVGDDVEAFADMPDINHRRLRDAEAIGAACRNCGGRTLLEIGTGDGRTTALMAANAPEALVHTVNMLPDDLPTAGRLVTAAPDRDHIGRRYRDLGLTNIRQIYANTATWTPDLGPIDLAFIDGCHDADFVVNDTRLVLAASHPGTVILWHDFAPPLRANFDWVDAVCRGVDRLYHRRLLRGPILHLRDSFVGIHVVP